MLENKIRAYSGRYMSDTKWRKLFSVVNRGTLDLGYCTWKLITDKEPKSGFLPEISQLGESFVGDCGALNGPFSFSEIEWLLIPRRHEWRPYQNAPVQWKSQDVEAILKGIQAVGQFEIDLSEQGLKVYGYKP